MIAASELWRLYERWAPSNYAYRQPYSDQNGQVLADALAEYGYEAAAEDLVTFTRKRSYSGVEKSRIESRIGKILRQIEKSGVSPDPKQTISVYVRYVHPISQSPTDLKGPFPATPLDFASLERARKWFTRRHLPLGRVTTFRQGEGKAIFVLARVAGGWHSVIVESSELSNNQRDRSRRRRMLMKRSKRKVSRSRRSRWSRRKSSRDECRPTMAACRRLMTRSSSEGYHYHQAGATDDLFEGQGLGYDQKRRRRRSRRARDYSLAGLTGGRGTSGAPSAKVRQMTNLLARAGYARPADKARALAAKGMSPDEVAFRLKVGGVERDRSRRCACRRGKKKRCTCKKGRR